MTQDITSITRTLIPANERTNVAHQLFGSAFLRLETTVYHLADSMAAEYNGGSWDFYLLSAGDRGQAFYMAPQREDDQPFTSHDHERQTGDGFPLPHGIGALDEAHAI